MTWPLVKRSVSAAAVHANPMQTAQSINILSFMHPSFLPAFLPASTSIGRIPEVDSMGGDTICHLL
jgi:hypothetical protein